MSVGTYPRSTTTDVRPGNTVFIITSDFKDIALFYPKVWRGTKRDHIDIVYYNSIDSGLLRVSGNLWRFRADFLGNKVHITK